MIFMEAIAYLCCCESLLIVSTNFCNQTKCNLSKNDVVAGDWSFPLMSFHIDLIIYLSLPIMYVTLGVTNPFHY